MADTAPFEIFLATAPGLEPTLALEAAEAGFSAPAVVPGAVTLQGGWPDVWRANLHLRGAARVLARIGGFRAMHPAQLDKRARKFPWTDTLRPGVPVRVEASCLKSRIYHEGAAAARVAAALEAAGIPVAETAELRLLVRIEDDWCGFSVDTSGAPLHRRGHKEAVGKAPLRETLAAAFLRACGYRGGETVVDPMCGSGTFVLEAAEIAGGLAPGRSRSFAFEHLASFDPAAWAAMRAAAGGAAPEHVVAFGHDRDAGAIRGAVANAGRAGLEAACAFACQPISALEPPDGPPGLVVVNPPYGGRIGNKDALRALYGTFGKVVAARFSGWRVGLVTSEAALAKTTGLPFAPPGPVVAHGPLKVRLWQAGPLV